MDTKEVMKQLAEEFPVDEWEWRPLNSGVNKKGAYVLLAAYLTNRAIQGRLDNVVGVGGWRNEYQKVGDKDWLCGISIKIDGEWITKWDGAPETEQESFKGGLSDSMKRAAVQWGIGRHLYWLETIYADVKDTPSKGYKGIKIKDNYYYWKPPDKYLSKNTEQQQENYTEPANYPEQDVPTQEKPDIKTPKATTPEEITMLQRDLMYSNDIMSEIVKSLKINTKEGEGRTKLGLFLKSRISSAQVRRVFAMSNSKNIVKEVIDKMVSDIWDAEKLPGIQPSTKLLSKEQAKELFDKIDNYDVPSGDTKKLSFDTPVPENENIPGMPF